MILVFHFCSFKRCVCVCARARMRRHAHTHMHFKYALLGTVSIVNCAIMCWKHSSSKYTTDNVW